VPNEKFRLSAAPSSGPSQLTSCGIDRFRPVGDFLPSFTGTASPDVDVTSSSVGLDPSATTFSLGAVLAAANVVKSHLIQSN
jgi:hypothetical protein